MRNLLPINKASNLVPERREGRVKTPGGFEEMNSGSLRVWKEKGGKKARQEKEGIV